MTITRDPVREFMVRDLGSEATIFRAQGRCTTWIWSIQTGHCLVRLS